MTHLDISNPGDSLRAMVRLRGREDGGCWLWFGGTVFGRPTEEAIEPLFGFQSVLWMTYKLDDDGGYVFRQRESCHFTDLKSGDVGMRFKNPYTAIDNPMIGYVSPVFAFRFYQDGTAPFGAGKTPLRESRLCPSLEQGGDDFWTTEWRRNEFMTAARNTEFPDASSGGKSRKSVDLATYRARAKDILDLSNHFVPAQLTFVADVPWIQWMFMGDRPGHMLWSGTGLKAADVDGLPDDLCSRIRQLHPGFLEDPFGMDGTPYGTLAQMRRLRDDGRL
ncbi:MAG: DUF1838 family protein [Rhodospirillaceae bacterium]